MKIKKRDSSGEAQLLQLFDLSVSPAQDEVSDCQKASQGEDAAKSRCLVSGCLCSFLSMGFSFSYLFFGLFNYFLSFLYRLVGFLDGFLSLFYNLLSIIDRSDYSGLLLCYFFLSLDGCFHQRLPGSGRRRGRRS